MKKLIYVPTLIAFIISLQSCTEVIINPDDPIPACEWDATEQLAVYDLQLRFPSTISTYHSYLIPYDEIERSMTNILDVNGDSGDPTRAQICATIIADGTECIGRATVDYQQGAPEVLPNMIEVPIPTNADFWGEATVGVRTDTFNNTSGDGNYYHIMWSETSNDPLAGIDINQMGTKITYGNTNGKTDRVYKSKDGCYYRDGNKVCP